MITEQDKALAGHCLDYARENGADKARVTFCSSVEDMVSVLDGETDKITHCEDSSVSLALFVDGRYGSFSTNNTERSSLEKFILEAIGTVRMLSEDKFRDLPDPQRCCREAVTGDELDIYDEFYPEMTPQLRRSTALGAAISGRTKEYAGCTLISEEGEYSDSIYETYVADTQGLSCLHRETCYDYGVEITVEGTDGQRYSSYWWEASEKFKDLDLSGCGMKALERAAGKAGAQSVKSGKYNMVVDSEVASKMVSPVLRALNGHSIQQHNSFLEGSIGKKLFPEGMTVVDLPHIKGSCCSKLFDSEGVATSERTIIDRGEVRTYFLSTYSAAKLGLEPTVDEAVRPKVMPWPECGLKLKDILERCGNGIYVTDFNGGNSNQATGDFSYGVEGFLFENGKIVRPVSEMLVTGNFLDLWSNLTAAGDDARECMSKLIPTLAFSKVDFSG